MTSVVFGQWTCFTYIDRRNEAREAFNMNRESWNETRHAYTKTSNGGSLTMTVLVKFTHNDTIILNRCNLTLRGPYRFGYSSTCIDFIFVVNGENKKHKLTIRNNSGVYTFDESIWTDEFIKDFKSASKCSIRVNQDYCTDDYYQFDFSGSAAAYDFITK